MADDPQTDVCVVCGGDLPDDPPTFIVPSDFALRMSPMASPGITKLAFCSERHKRDWKDANRGEFPESDTETVDNEE